MKNEHVIQSDSLALVARMNHPDVARGALRLRLVEDFDRGVAIVPGPGVVVELETGISCISYRAIAGGEYPARIDRRWPDGTVDIRVYIPGSEDPVHLTAVQVVHR